MTFKPGDRVRVKGNARCGSYTCLRRGAEALMCRAGDVKAVVRFRQGIGDEGLQCRVCSNLKLEHLEKADSTEVEEGT
jgi:hypothetical protein